MPRDTLDTVVKSLQAIFFLMMIVITVYGQLSPYLNDFWKGFALGALVVFLPMLVFNIYLSRKRTKEEPHAKPLEKNSDKQPRAQQPAIVILGVEELLPALREFMTRWEQYERLAIQQKWQMASQGGIQQFAKELSSRLLSLDSKYAESWDFGIRNQVQIVSSDLQKLGLRQISIFTGEKGLQDMAGLGKSAYEKSRALVLFLTTRQRNSACARAV